VPSLLSPLPPSRLHAQSLTQIPDATICGYAVNINNAMVEGVIVKKETARAVFESEVRKEKRGPAIAEHVAGNVFKTRVYPIPANGTRTISLTYSQDLTLVKGRLEYVLALWADGNVEKISFSATVFDISGVKSSIRFEKGKEVDVKVMPSFSQTSFCFEKCGLLEERIFIDQMWKGQKLNSRCLLGKDREEVFFAIQDSVDARGGGRMEVDRIGILFDISWSRREVDKEMEFRVILELLRRLGDVAVDVILFSRAPQSPVSFRVRGGNGREVVNFLRGVEYFGGTDYSGIVDVFNGGYNFFLMFSDGFSTWGKGGGIYSPGLKF